MVAGGFRVLQKGMYLPCTSRPPSNADTWLATARRFPPLARKAALVFFWGPMERSVRVEGTVTKVSEEATAAYFRSRPRDSQIGAWVSRQSSIVGSPGVLKAREEELIGRFEGLAFGVGTSLSQHASNSGRGGRDACTTGSSSPRPLAAPAPARVGGAGTARGSVLSA